MFTSTGTIRYSPKKEEGHRNWWVILDCDPALGKYYRHLYHRGHHGCRKLAQPFWGPHITILRNEEPDDAFKHLWGKYTGESVEFQYSSGLQNNYSPQRYKSFWWLDVVCPRFEEIRAELGLEPVNEAWNNGTYHLTIGTWENPGRKAWFMSEFRGIDIEDDVV